jgi:hypothetical protein
MQEHQHRYSTTGLQTRCQRRVEVPDELLTIIKGQSDVVGFGAAGNNLCQWCVTLGKVSGGCLNQQNGGNQGSDGGELEQHNLVEGGV